MAAARTSQTHPLQIAEVRASPSHGRIGITFCPGKHDNAASTGAWARDLSVDLDAIATWGARLVLTLNEPAELAALKVPHLGTQIRGRGSIGGICPSRTTRFRPRPSRSNGRRTAGKSARCFAAAAMCSYIARGGWAGLA